MSYSSIPETQEHISNVAENIAKILELLIQRMVSHDAVKMRSPELEIFDEYTPKLKTTTYGSDTYKNYLKKMQVALDHHYSNCPHHPEHYENGIDGMNLIDIMEMLCDWYAATKRHADGDINKSLEINQKRFNISPQLISILKNTVELL